MKRTARDRIGALVLEYQVRQCAAQLRRQRAKELAIALAGCVALFAAFYGVAWVMLCWRAALEVLGG